MGTTQTAPAASRAPAPGTRARRTHDAILDATEHLLAEGGYPAATTTAMAERAGVSVGTVYGYFSDRDDVLAGLLSQRLDGLLEAVLEVLSIERLLDVGLDRTLDDAVAVVVEGYRRHAAVLRAALVQLPSSPSIREVYWARHADSHAALATFLRRAQAAGKVRVGDLEVLTDALLVMIQGLNHPLVLRGDAAADRLADEISRALRDLLSPAAGG